jgi:4-amino-4-deoxychorismate lyase
MSVNGSDLDTIAINDRGFAYGDGVFETILIQSHQPVLINAHLDRLQRGAEKLRIPLDRKVLEQEISQRSADFPAQGILKIIVSRGLGGRGYRPAKNNDTTRVLSFHPLPDYGSEPVAAGVNVFVCNQRLAIQPSLAGIKHLNRLEQVLASQEWPEGDFMEGIMLDMNDHVIEGTRSNIFWVEAGQIFTPSLEQCGVAGIMRHYLSQHLDAVLEIEDCTLSRLLNADEVFLCNSVFGVWPVKSILSDSKVSLYGVEPDARVFSLRASRLFDELLKNPDATE